jgi:integrase
MHVRPHVGLSTIPLSSNLIFDRGTERPFAEVRSSPYFDAKEAAHMKPRRVALGIYQRSEGSYWIRVYLGRDDSGKRLYHQETIRGSLQQAKARAAEVKHNYNTGAYTAPSKMTVGEYLEQWMADWVAGLRPKTVATYRRAVDHMLPEIGGIPLQKLTPLHLQKYYRKAQEKLGASTVNQHHRVIHAALETAVEAGLLQKNPAHVNRRRGGLAPPRPRKQSGNAWTAEELARFLDYVSNHRLFAMYALAAVTGLRRGELLGLRWEDVDLWNRELRVRQTYIVIDGKYHMQEMPKTEESEKPLSLSPAMVSILYRHKEQQDASRRTRAELGLPYEDHGLVFDQESGRPLRPDQLSGRDFPRLCAKAGVPRIRFHDIRHTYASQLIAKGYDVKVVQERLRHTRASTTIDIYPHLSRQAEREAAAATDDVLPKTGRKNPEAQGV